MHETHHSEQFALMTLVVLHTQKHARRIRCAVCYLGLMLFVNLCEVPSSQGLLLSVTITGTYVEYR